jgi:methyl-accepting chemotaxis protein
MKNMTIGKKLYSAFGMMVLFTLITGGLAIYNIGSLGGAVQQLGDHWVRVSYLGGRTSALVPDMLSLSRGILVRGYMRDLDAARNYHEQYNADYVQFRQITDELKSVTWGADEMDIIQHEILDKMPEYVSLNDEMYNDVVKGDLPAASTVYDKKLNPLAIELRNSGNKLTEMQRKHGADYAAQAVSGVGPARTLSIVMMLLSLGIGMVVVYIVRGISKALGDSVAELRDGADQVANAAAQVSSSSQSLAQGSSEQAASLEETSASSEEINSMARKNTDNSRKTAELLTQSMDKVNLANRHLDQMVVSMNEINESSGKISKIIKVIDEIAFQTNILALNAAVEAARAGEAGMGFAVVADEVRSLAQRSAQAAKDTATLIEDSIAKSSEGKGKVDQVAAAIRTITEESARIKVMVDEVSLGSEEQSRGIDQIGKAIAQMEQVTQTTAANAEESAAAAEELNAQSETLKDVVARLQRMVEDDGGRDTYRGQQLSSQRARTSITPRAVAARPLQPVNTLRGHSAPAFAETLPQSISKADSFPLEESFRSF